MLMCWRDMTCSKARVLSVLDFLMVSWESKALAVIDGRHDSGDQGKWRQYHKRVREIFKPQWPLTRCHQP
jgi:hypothetical protein